MGPAQIYQNTPGSIMAAIGRDFFDFLQTLNIKKEVNKDNWVFRVATAGSYSVLIICIITYGLTTYFGNPIVCDARHDKTGGNNLREFSEAYCWVHGTANFTGYKRDGHPCQGKEGEEDHSTLYYQWVVFMLLCSAILLRSSGWLWSTLEGGLMSIFYNEQFKGNRALRMSSEKIANFVNEEGQIFKDKIKGSKPSKNHIWKFLGCELLALTMIVANFILTDSFLSYKFKYYGWNVMDYYWRKETMTGLTNPMCNAFPTKVSCNLGSFGSSGLAENDNLMCILNQNIINEKIFLFLWFWFIAMFIILAIQILMDLCFILFLLPIPKVKQFCIYLFFGIDLPREVKDYLTRCSIGDVYFLHQMSKNMHSSVFHELLRYLSQSRGIQAAQDPAEGAPLIPNGEKGIELRQRNITQDV